MRRFVQSLGIRRSTATIQIGAEGDLEAQALVRLWSRIGNWPPGWIWEGKDEPLKFGGWTPARPSILEIKLGAAPCCEVLGTVCALNSVVLILIPYISGIRGAFAVSLGKDATCFAC